MTNSECGKFIPYTLAASALITLTFLTTPKPFSKRVEPSSPLAAGAMVPSSCTSAAGSKAGISNGGLMRAHEWNAPRGKCALTPMTVPKRFEGASLV
jgi:hypothetical protein